MKGRVQLWMQEGEEFARETGEVSSQSKVSF